jgi:hypothetical protein
MAAKQTPQTFNHQPQPTVAKAVAAANAHVAAVNAAAKRKSGGK